MITEIEDYDKTKILIGERFENLINYAPEDAKSIILISGVNVD
jgi:hypothetical protein